MAKLRAHNISMSVDGYMAGPNQSLDNPLGENGESLHDWVFKTKTWTDRTGEGAGEQGLDDRFMARGDEGIGATIMGRNMFGPVRGLWEEDDDWKGWWGDNPPYHHPVFVLTHYPRDPIPMEGGTTFNFVADGIEAALAMAVEAADGKDVRLGGGASTIRQYLKAGLLDDLHLAIAPILLGSGERIFDNLEGGLDGYEVVEFVSSPAVAHVRIAPRRQ